MRWKKTLNETFSKIETIWKEEAIKQAAKDTTEKGKLAAFALEKVSE